MRFKHPRGLLFQCDRCALCCGDTEKRVRTILLLKSEACRIRLKTGKRFDEFVDKVEGFQPYVYRMKKTESGKCLFLDGNLCSIYDLRPLVCRFYPFELEGSGKGKYVFIPSHECPCIGTGEMLKKERFNDLFKAFMEAMKEEGCCG